MGIRAERGFFIFSDKLSKDYRYYEEKAGLNLTIIIKFLRSVL